MRPLQWSLKWICRLLDWRTTVVVRSSLLRFCEGLEAIRRSTRSSKIAVCWLLLVSRAVDLVLRWIWRWFCGSAPLRRTLAGGVSVGRNCYVILCDSLSIPDRTEWRWLVLWCIVVSQICLIICAADLVLLREDYWCLLIWLYGMTLN
jgi:hypothetical protein